VSDNRVILIGYSGHGYVVAEAALLSGMGLQYYAEKERTTTNPYNLEYLGFEGSDDFPGWNMEVDFILGIGSNNLRAKIARLVKENQGTILSVIHPKASISVKSEIGDGSFVGKNVSVNPLVRIGSNCILNTSCIIEHECHIGDAVHIAPGAVLTGNVCVGDRSFIGANSVIKQGVRIGKDVVVGAGSVILKDIPDTCTVVGNPGRFI
jgi:sugar O-acyltransferase (sialic acid O-acetyltransferase NeuD family)